MQLLIILLILLLIYILAVIIFIIPPLFYGAPYEPTDKKTIQTMIKFAKPLKNKKVADLGSGDGRLVIEFAKHGAEAHGYEINPLLVYISRKKIKSLNLQNKAFIHWRNFWKQDLSKYSIITLFQISYLMPKLEKKFKKELKPNSKIISNKWVFPNLKLKKQIKRTKFYQI